MSASVSGRIGQAPGSELIAAPAPAAASSARALSPAPLHSNSGGGGNPFAGSMDSASASASAAATSLQEGTLDEPVSTTLMRDLRRVAIKLKHVLIPKDTVKELRDWDLWGPLILCLLLASTLSLSASGPQAALIFAAVFVLVWAGAGIITLNAALLGGHVSTLQSVCVLGYCLAPLNVASILCHIWGNPIYHLVVVALGFVWATRASVGFMAQLLEEKRKALGVYPVLLFYAAISWMILVQ